MSYGKEILEFAPKLKQVTEEVLFDDIWQRKELQLREKHHYLNSVSVVRKIGTIALSHRSFKNARS